MTAFFRFTVSLAALCAATPLLAQTAPAPDAASTEGEEGAILVTATRAPLELDEVPASVTVLDKAAIDRSQDIGVAELLQRTPGVTLSRNGGFGTATSLRIRGAETDQTVVVIDGVKFNDPAAVGSGFDFGNLLVGDADRIEVLRGPQSILWGSQAIGGVVNVVTAEAERPLEGSFDVEAGSRETVSGRAALGGRTGPLNWRIAGQTFTTDGISAVAPGFGGGEADGFTNRNASGRATLDIAPGLSAEVRGYYSDGRLEIDAFDGDSADYSLTQQFVGYAGINLDLLDGRFRNRFAYSHTDTDRANYSPGSDQTLTFESEGTNQRLEYQGSLAITTGVSAIIGLENERAEFRSRSPFGPLPLPPFITGDAEITSGYAQISVQPIDGLTLNGGVRHDDHSDYGGKTLFGAGAVWRLPTDTIVRASYGEGFKAPSLYQLFSEYGNLSLQPEEAEGWDAGVEQQLFDGRLRLGATYFERTTTNQIIFNSCFGVTGDPLCLVPGSASEERFGYYLNAARAEAHGIEASGALSLGALTLDGNYSWTVAEDRSAGAATFGNWLPRRPRDTANGSISYAFPFGLTAGAAIRWSGKSYNDAGNTTELDDYTLVDLRAEYALSDEVRLFARGENLFDEDYQTTYGFGTLGRSIYLGIRGRF